MIQDIFPHQFTNHYENKTPAEDSKILCFRENQVLIRRTEAGELILPDYGQLKDVRGKLQTRYLFSIDQTDFFLVMDDVSPHSAEVGPYGYDFTDVRPLRQILSKEVCFAVMTAWHLVTWYRDNQFCGRCGHRTVHDERERMMRCPACGNLIFPKIAPAVIVCVTDGDRILLSKYADRDYKKYALLAGFTEIGETAEETVAREVMEEVGLRVKNITYYKSQPWGIDSNLLLGFFCQLDGEDTITIDTQELSTAQWFHRNEMPAHDDGISLTREMMDVFEKNLEKFY